MKSIFFTVKNQKVLEYKKESKISQELAVEVGQFLKIQKSKKISSSKGRDIKLELDSEAESIIIEKLLDQFGYPILSEEKGVVGKMSDSIPYWIVDPIDGTLNYSRGFEINCVSIALWKAREPILGVIYDFNRDDLFIGCVGQGASLNDESLTKPDYGEISQSILATGIPSNIEISKDLIHDFYVYTQTYKKIRMIGSAAMSMACVASGKFDTYIENQINIWDIAAGYAIIKAIGIDNEIIFLDDNKVNIKIGNYQ